ncbi:hypothetical protein MAXJ12_36371 [Mesorhizobium alhagi CCNWXJ12-2]|jgi:hypothetical protein|uniref:Uncharacterized protein n=1 Tax=Mesorhizobium alhagi CCNWXJ12-2 TaxID=1107882 RepID=H0I451_9HYPH|nr:hypothetical protein MAXJ12_36371 [Mesorhizobium alhagi CCNWXJ12-2]
MVDVRLTPKVQASDIAIAEGWPAELNRPIARLDASDSHNYCKGISRTSRFGTI